MGIRFSCPHCGKSLNVKTELAGKRGLCPNCKGRIDIPTLDAGGRWVSNQESSTTTTPSPNSANSANRTGSQSSGSGNFGSGSSGSSSSSPNSLGAGSPARTPSSSPTVAPQAFEDLDPNSFVLDRPTVETSSVPNHVIDWIADAPEAVWYVRNRAGGQYGPAIGSIMRTWLQEGRVSRECYVWREGWSNWRQAVDVFPQLLTPPASLPYSPSGPNAACPNTGRPVTGGPTGYSASAAGSVGNSGGAGYSQPIPNRGTGTQGTGPQGRVAQTIPVAAVTSVPTQSADLLTATRQRQSSSTWLFLSIIVFILCISCVGFAILGYIFYPTLMEMNEKSEQEVRPGEIFDPFQ